MTARSDGPTRRAGGRTTGKASQDHGSARTRDRPGDDAESLFLFFGAPSRGGLARESPLHARSSDHDRPTVPSAARTMAKPLDDDSMRVSKRVILLVSREKRVRVPRGDEVHAGPDREGPSPVASRQCFTAVLHGSGGRQSQIGRGGWQAIEDWSRQAPNRDQML
jgi:hypothetical protein